MIIMILMIIMMLMIMIIIFNAYINIYRGHSRDIQQTSSRHLDRRS